MIYKTCCLPRGKQWGTKNDNCYLLAVPCKIDANVYIWDPRCFYRSPQIKGNESVPKSQISNLNPTLSVDINGKKIAESLSLGSTGLSSV